MGAIKAAAVLGVGILTAAGCGGGNTGPAEGGTAPGEQRTAKTAALATGAAVLQDKTPVDQIALYLVGFHPSKAEPHLQMESHHYCHQVNEDFAQCVLYDGNTEYARLHGVEYIISAKLYDTLADEEKPYWHPHNYEILSGQLQMPGLPDAAERAALHDKMNTYGKTWHFWKSGVHGEADHDLPLGPPDLAWSLNHDGEAVPGMVEARDSRMGLNTAAKREQRAEWVSEARPQGGVAALSGAFPDARPFRGVEDNGDRRTLGVPTIRMENSGAVRR
jgi:hypothetical protein